ncbi:MAG: 23S rRNA (adenine(2503)-C(2))-methyltransferase RlmN [Bryobacteraceae bacterium]|nr:23S rRNA (adenine(2503)-C(2))-methyltransferase RlmN [Bryobacteraceae bacterium]
MGPSLIGMELADIAAVLGPDEPAYRARQIYEAVYRRRVPSLAGITNIPRDLRRRLAETASVGLPELQQRYDSADGTIRYLLRLQDGLMVETVVMPEDGRYTICISTQVGCAVDCKFCLTALMGLERNLTTGEIVGQVLFAALDQRLDPESAKLNIVTMGQGEPLLNLPNVLKATRLLADPAGVGVSQRRMTLSTSGIVPRIEELGRAPTRPKLAVSLNASTEEQRRQLMPVTRKYRLSDLLEACRAYPLRPWEKLTFEYVLLRGVNDSDADARRVARLLARLNCKVNLIALNPGPGILFETPEPERVHAFQQVLRRSFPCFVRKPRGLDIYAACGQLKRMSGGSDAGAAGLVPLEAGVAPRHPA